VRGGTALALEAHDIVAVRPFDAVEAGEKVDVPKCAAEFAVGDRPHSGGFLQANFVTNAAVFALLFGRYFAALSLLADILKLLRAQQAADLIGTKRRVR